MQGWKTAYSNYDQLTEFRSNVWSDPKQCSSKGLSQNVDEEVIVLQTRLRSNEYLLTPAANKPHVTRGDSVYLKRDGFLL